LPRFSTFMGHISPFPYFVGSMFATALANTAVRGTSVELVSVKPLIGAICVGDLSHFLRTSGGRLMNREALSSCEYCPVASTNAVLEGFGISYETRWRGLRLQCVLSVVNLAAVFDF
ncbi:hypothetical protein IQ06DRAFT_212554, partial [Phaeosphaeriaceae sp. SRC1lsM3a]